MNTFNSNGHSDVSNFFAGSDGLIINSCACCISCQKMAKLYI